MVFPSQVVSPEVEDQLLLLLLVKYLLDDGERIALEFAALKPDLLVAVFLQVLDQDLNEGLAGNALVFVFEAREGVGLEGLFRGAFGGFEVEVVCGRSHSVVVLLQTAFRQ